MPFSKLKGRDLMLCDVLYQRGSIITEWKDYITIIYKDMVKGTKEKLIIEEPTINLYIVKDEFRTFRKPRHFLPLNQLDVKEVRYKNVLHEIAKIAGGKWLDYYKSHQSSKERKNLYMYPYCLGGDINIETYYRVLWKNQVGNTSTPDIQKIFLDIEVDQIDYDGNIARHGECEVNAITVLDDVTSNVYTFLLDNGNNPLIKEFCDNQDEVDKQLHDTFDNDYGVFNYFRYMFTDEKELLIQTFKLINSLHREFCLIWNMGFDIPYLIDRGKVLGLNPADYMCCKDFPSNTMYYYEDTASFEFSSKRDSFTISANTHYSDQLINYASLRKSQGTVKRVNLDYVANKEVGVGKVGYSNVATIRTLPYVDYTLFYIYNVGDVISQCLIERKCQDLENVYMISMINNISYTDALKQTVTFRGLMYGYLLSKDLILAHNVNFNNKSDRYDENGDIIIDVDGDSFEGAINGDPMLNLENGVDIYGKPSKFLLRWVIDFDFSAMYPNSITAFNIFATTMIGKLYVDYALKNPYDEDVGKEYVEDLISNDLVQIGEKWHNLSPIEDIIIKIQSKYGRSSVSDVS